MSSQEPQDYLLFATEIGGPMTFTFVNLLRFEVNKLTDIIQVSDAVFLIYIFVQVHNLHTIVTMIMYIVRITVVK